VQLYTEFLCKTSILITGITSQN